MKKKIAIITMIVTLMFSSMTVYASEPASPTKPAFTMALSAETVALYGQIDAKYNEVDEIIVEDFYVNRYEDLKLAYGFQLEGASNHFMEFGLAEERVASPVLDVVQYRENYPDLQVAFGYDWDKYTQHYFQYGILEGRDNGTDFNPQIYLSMYPDLQAAFGEDNYVAATKHYLEYGYDEGRMYNWPEPEIIYRETESDISNDDSNDSSGGNANENFTGDKRIDGEGGSYRILSYVNGVVVANKIYDEDDILIIETVFTYDAAGTLISSQTKGGNGIIDSESMYYESGREKSVIHYNVDGTKSHYIETDERGNQTLVIYYQEDGITEDIRAVYIYDENNNMTSEKTYLSDGSSCETTYENGVRTYQVDINADGERYETEYYEDGESIKKITDYYTDGTKYVAERWENGNMKTCTWYDASGNMTRQQTYNENEELISDIY